MSACAWRRRRWLAAPGGKRSNSGSGALVSAKSFNREGERARAEELWREVEELAERTHVVSVKLMVSRRDVILAIVDGHLEDALVQWRRYVERADELGASLRGRIFGLDALLAPASTSVALRRG